MAQVLAAAARSYRPPAIVSQLINQRPPLILSAVTAAGKNTVSKFICERDNGYSRLVTYTTRRPRSGESSGRDYWFLNDGQMFDQIKRQILLESQVIHDFVYASPIEGYLKIVNQNKTPILTIDVHGAALLGQINPSLRPYFLIPPSFDEWMQRLGSRAFLSDGERNRRLHSAADELSVALSNNNFIFIVTHDSEAASQEILSGMAVPASQEPTRRLAKELHDYIRNQ